MKKVYCKYCTYLVNESVGKWRCSALIETWFSEKDHRRDNSPSEKNKNNDCEDFINSRSK